jgi:hypothetical protein
MQGTISQQYRNRWGHTCPGPIVMCIDIWYPIIRFSLFSVGTRFWTVKRGRYQWYRFRKLVRVPEILKGHRVGPVPFFKNGGLMFKERVIQADHGLLTQCMKSWITAYQLLKMLAHETLLALQIMPPIKDQYLVSRKRNNECYQ